MHLSTGSSGGAAVAAKRLNDALCEFGVESQFISLKRENFNPAENEIGVKRSIKSRLISKFYVKINISLSSRIPFSVVSSNVLNYKKLSSLGSPSNTILHIHNWYNLINYKEISKLSNLGYAIVFTMHDQRLFTGGCHYAYACKGFQTDCKKCPHLSGIASRIPSKNLMRATKFVDGFMKQVTFIAPSYWILNEAKKSHLLRRSTIEFIPNTLHSHFFNVQSHREIKLDTQNIYLGVASVDRESFIKGGELLGPLEKFFSEKNMKISFIFLSDSDIQKNSVKFFWQKIDFLFVPSKIDNSPNVIHEAKRIGLPVIATKVGGITELLDPDFDIALEENFDFSSLVGFIRENLSKGEYEKRQIEMQRKFDLYVGGAVDKHINLYFHTFNG